MYKTTKKITAVMLESKQKRFVLFLSHPGVAAVKCLQLIIHWFPLCVQELDRSSIDDTRICIAVSVSPSCCSC